MANRQRHSDRTRDPEITRITSAPTSRKDDINRRQKRYLISMGVRTLCFVGAIVVGDNWFRWVLVAGAFILPYIAVVMANSSGSLTEGPDIESPDIRRRELPGPS